MGAVEQVTGAAVQGIPRLFEWGGLVTLLVLIVIAFGFTMFGLSWVIWQMYKQNQEMFSKTVDATNRGTTALEKLTEFVKGKGSVS